MSWIKHRGHPGVVGKPITAGTLNGPVQRGVNVREQRRKSPEVLIQVSAVSASMKILPGMPEDMNNLYGHRLNR